MQYIKAECSSCGNEKPIVNKRHMMCDDCNYIRLNGESKQEKAKRRAKELEGKHFSSRKESGGNERSKSGWGSVNNSDRKSYGRTNGEIQKGLGRRDEEKSEKTSSDLKRKYSIRNISSKPKNRTSTGEVISEALIKQRYAACIDQIQLDREPVCQGCGRGDVPLSFSHTISRKRCKELGKSELIYDPDNIEIECYQEPTSSPTACHNIWEVGTLKQKQNLLNFQRKLLFIKQHDPEQYRKLTLSQ